MVAILPEDFQLQKYGVIIRLVKKEDATFIIKLRLNQERNQYVHNIGTNIETQIQWIESYKSRQLKGLEYYFILCDSFSIPYGTTRLYNFTHDSFETGSWVFLENAPIGMAVLGDIIGREIAFEFLGFTKCRFEVQKENKSVIKNYHLKYNPSIINEDEINYYFELDKDQFYNKRTTFLKLLGHDIK